MADKITDLGEVPGVRKLKHGGERVPFSSLVDKIIIIKDVIEVEDTKYGRGMYARAAGEIPAENNRQVTFNSPSQWVTEKLKRARPYLPVSARVSKKQSSRTSGREYLDLEGVGESIGSS